MTHSQKLTVLNGKVFMDLEILKGKATFMGDGDYILILEKINENKDYNDWLREYSAKRDLLVLETGYTRKEMHELIKDIVLSKVLTEPLNRTSEDLSTKSLTPIGWKMFMLNLRLWAASELNTYL